MVVVVVVFTLTRMYIHRTGSSQSVAGEYPKGNTNKPKVVHAYITADAIHASTKNI